MLQLPSYLRSPARLWVDCCRSSQPLKRLLARLQHTKDMLLGGLITTPGITGRPLTLPAPRRDCLCPVVLTRGADQAPVSTKFDMRSDPNVIRNYGKMLVSLAAVVPDGIVCFFVSYRYMDAIIAKWHEMGILQVRCRGNVMVIHLLPAICSSGTAFSRTAPVPTAAADFEEQPCRMSMQCCSWRALRPC